eukprot:scaffold198688_cov26-Tisochrysis_lutea.AAC.3
MTASCRDFRIEASLSSDSRVTSPSKAPGPWCWEDPCLVSLAWPHVPGPSHPPALLACLAATAPGSGHRPTSDGATLISAPGLVALA